jgi:hypothetical protein
MWSEVIPLNLFSPGPFFGPNEKPTHSCNHSSIPWIYFLATIAAGKGACSRSGVRLGGCCQVRAVDKLPVYKGPREKWNKKPNAKYDSPVAELPK